MKQATLFAALLALMLGGSSSAARENRARRDLVVMTRNLYIGVDVYRILEAETLQQIPPIVSQIYGILVASNPSERMDAVAEEIAGSQPHLIGLQEVYKVRTQFPGDAHLGNPTSAEEEVFDYLELLLQALENRGLHYRVVSVVEEVDAELPGVFGLDPNGNPIFFDVRVTDRDVILARCDVETANETHGHYSSLALLPLGETAIVSPRGYTAIDAWVHGQKVRFVNTHLEVDFDGAVPQYQADQALELVTELAAVEDPVVLVGDFNSHPEQQMVDGYVPPYRRLQSAEFVDAWTIRRGQPQPGNTCCHAELLDNEEPDLRLRVDQIWIRNGDGRGDPHNLGRVKAETTGDRPEQRTLGGQWPSDHAGVVARMRLRRSK